MPKIEDKDAFRRIEEAIKNQLGATVTIERVGPVSLIMRGELNNPELRPKIIAIAQSLSPELLEAALLDWKYAPNQKND